MLGRRDRALGHVCGLLVLLWASQAEAQILSLVVDRSGGAPSFWWSTSGPAQLTAFDEVLRTALGEHAVDVVGGPPRPVSRVYRTAELSDASARNLGGLYGASQVLRGDLALTVQGEMPLGFVAELELSFRLIAVDTEIVHIEARHRSLGQGTSREAAMADARRRLAEGLTTQLAPWTTRGGQGSAGTPVASAPTLVVHDLESADPLVALMGELRAWSDVVADVREVWASEGRLALEVRLRTGHSAGELEAILAALAASTDWGHSLIIERHQGLTTDIRLRSMAE